MCLMRRDHNQYRLAADHDLTVGDVCSHFSFFVDIRCVIFHKEAKKKALFSCRTLFPSACLQNCFIYFISEEIRMFLTLNVFFIDQFSFVF